MSELATDNRVEELVAAAKRAKAGEPAPSRRAKRIQQVDFRRPTKFTQDQQRRMSRGHDSFCRATSTVLSAELRTPIELDVIMVDQQTWSAAVLETPQRALYAVLEASTGGRILFALEGATAMHLLERQLGGSSTSDVASDREFTEIELRLASRFVSTMVAQLSRTWEELMSVSLTLVDVHSQQTGVQLAPTSEPTLIVTMEVRIAERNAPLSVLVPYRSVVGALDGLSTGYYGEQTELVAEEETAAAVRSALGGVVVELRAEVGSTDLTVDEFVALEPGSLVKLGPADAGSFLYADDVAIHKTKPGRSGKRRAVEVVEAAFQQ
jgi:flagellar motor switch protein FliM